MSRPSLELKKTVDHPLFIMYAPVKFNTVLIHATKVCLKPDFLRNANRKSWSTESNAFRYQLQIEFSLHWSQCDRAYLELVLSFHEYSCP